MALEFAHNPKTGRGQDKKWNNFISKQNKQKRYNLH